MWKTLSDKTNLKAENLLSGNYSALFYITIYYGIKYNFILDIIYVNNYIL